ncbi:MAG: SPASM domain-containing protein, partial [Candidatus Margulisiibacteriota bacterium]
AKAIQEYAGFVAVSLDGAKEDTHERMRVIKGSFKASLEGIKNLVAAGIRPQVVFCITQWNKHEFRDLIMMCKELGCKNMKVNKPTHIARGENLEKAGELLTIKQILDYYKIARQYSEELDFEIIYSVPPAFKPLDRVAKESGCKCSIHRLLGITGDGTISMCGIVRTVDNLSMGNIKTADLAKVWNDDPILNRIRDEIPDRLTGICQNCIHKKACMAYCVALNYFDMGQLTAPFKFCQDAHEEGLFPRTRLIQKVAHI